METEHIILKRPKRKLCYTTNKQSVPEKWVDGFTLADVDKMFDDLDPPSDCDSQVSSFPQQQSSDTQHSGGEASPSPGDIIRSTPCRKEPEMDALLPAERLISPKLGTDFQMPGPVKTSSPIEENVVLEHVEKEITRTSPILFDCEDEETEEAATESLTAQKSQMSGDSVLNSPPSKFALRKLKGSCLKYMVDGPLSTEETPEKPQASEGKGNTSSQKNSGKPSPAVSQESEHDTSTRAGKDLPTFLQKLRDVGQLKAARKPPTPVKNSPPPAEPEDNFLILEDDVSLLFTIPKKPASSGKQRQGSSSSTDKDASTNGSPRAGAQPEEAPVIQKTRRRKERVKKNEGTGSGNEKDEFTNPEDVPMDELVEQGQEQEKLNKKKKLKKIPAKESDEAAEDATDAAARRETADENPAQRAGGKVQTASQPKRLKSSKENAKTSRSESLKRSRKVKRGSGGVKESENDDEAAKEPRQTRHSTKQHADLDLDSHAADEIRNLDTEAKDSAGGKVKDRKQQVVSEGSFSEEGQILCKRKRKPVGQWWLSCPQSTEEPEEVKDDPPPVLKKSKRRKKEPSAPAPSPAKTKKDNVKKRPGKRSTVSSSQDAVKAQLKSPKRPRNRRVTQKSSPSAFTQTDSSPISDTPAVDRVGGSTAGPADDVTVTDNPTLTGGEVLVAVDGSDFRSLCLSPSMHDAPQGSGLLRDLRSGPSSMIVMEECESDDTAVRPPSVPPELRLSDLCAPPLKPLVLQPKDKANLTEWFKSLWSSSVDNGGITAEHFDWYFYQGRAMGVLVDLNCGSICNGKLLLGSHMKKPLWVDHSATTVFNLFTSSVSVVINGRKSNVNAGDSFMVQCGEAYSLQNTSAQPAALYFTRILAESSD